MKFISAERLRLSEQIRQKKQSEGVHFYSFGTQNTVLYCQNYTPTDYFFGDFAHSIK